MRSPVIAVIGAGFSGSLIALHLQALCPPGTRIELIERSGRFGPGLAHATHQAGHLLNVVAGRMSAWPDKPSDFLDWLRHQPSETLQGVMPGEHAFIPRRLFGAYVSALVRRAAETTQPSNVILRHDQAVGISRAAGAVQLSLASGVVLQPDIVVLATGNGPTLPPHQDAPALEAAGLWRSDPWHPETLAGLDPGASVVMIGTGLSMVDLVTQLLDTGHAGPITAMSRNGLLPKVHVDPPAPHHTLTAPLPRDLCGMMRAFRHEVAAAEAAGLPWHSVVDAMRPLVAPLWQGLTLAEQQRFLRHVRPRWDIHRHRMAPAIAARISAAQASGQLRIISTRIDTASVVGRRAELRFRHRGETALQTLQADRIITCTGPCSDVTRNADPLLQSLLRQGYGRPDALRLGLDVTTEGAVLAQDGSSPGDLFALGPLTKGRMWEITAVPNIRQQCQDVATSIAAQLAGQPAEATVPVTLARFAELRPI